MAGHNVKKRSFTVAEKLEILLAAEQEPVSAVARHFDVNRSSIYAWMGIRDQLETADPSTRRLPSRTRSQPSAAGQTSTSNPPSSVTRASTDEQQTTLGSAGPLSTGIDDHQQPLSSSPTQATPDNSDEPTDRVTLVAYCGQEGSFSELAGRYAFHHRLIVEMVPYAQIPELLEAIEKQEVDFGVIPAYLLQSASGLLELLTSDLKIVSEIVLLQALCLCALPTARLGDIDCILSDPACLERCENAVRDIERSTGHAINRQSTWDSAGACETTKEENVKNIAAIASETAAQTNDLVVLDENIADNKNDRTAHFVLARTNDPSFPLEKNDRAADGATGILVVSTPSDVSPRSPPSTATRPPPPAAATMLPTRVRSMAVSSTTPPCASQATTHLPLLSSMVVAARKDPYALSSIAATFARSLHPIVEFYSRPPASVLDQWSHLCYIKYRTSADPNREDTLQRHLSPYAVWIKHLGTYAIHETTKPA